MFSSRALRFAAAVGLLTILVTAEPHLAFEDTDAADGRLLGGTVSIICQSSEYFDDNECKGCSTGCDACAAATECTACKSSMYLHNGKCEDCPTGCDACVDANTCARCESSMYLHNGQCKQSCPGGFIATGSGADVKTCEDTKFGFRTGELVQSVKDANIVGYVVGFSNDKVEVSRRGPPYDNKVESMTPKELHTISVGDRVSSPWGEGVLTASGPPDAFVCLGYRYPCGYLYSYSSRWGYKYAGMQLVSKAYQVVQAFGGKAVCKGNRVDASCGNCGPHWGTFDQCKELCDSHSGCSYFTYFSDARCQMYSSCSTMSDGGGATTAIYRNAQRVSHWAVDGAPADRGGGHKEDTCAAVTTLAAATRCCSDDPNVICKSICPAGIVSLKAAKKQYTTYADAVAKCANVGRRLCTVEELKNNVCRGTGCWFNQVLVWTSDSCVAPLNGVRRLSAAEVGLTVLV